MTDDGLQPRGSIGKANVVPTKYIFDPTHVHGGTIKTEKEIHGCTIMQTRRTTR